VSTALWYTEHLNRTGYIKGRGAVANPAGRFENQGVSPFDDGWTEPDEARPRTEVTAEVTRNIITGNDSPDVPFTRSVNPYKGCEHGCAYCFARPSHAYLGLSPGLDFETKITSKPDAAERLTDALSKPSYRCEPLALGANTDPYQPVETKLGITRSILQVLSACHHPVGILTKSDSILRDLDLLQSLAERRLVHVFLSITSLDRSLARRLEPRAASPHRRLRAIEKLTAAGVPTGVLASPMIPGLNDHELESIVAASAAAGATTAGTILIRLPGQLKSLFDGWLEANVPLRRRRVLKLIRDCHGGDLYDHRYGTRMRGQGPYADLLQRRFHAAIQRYGLSKQRFELDCSQFAAPPRRGRPRRQLTLF